MVIHNEITKSHKCENCNKAFYFASELKFHEKSHESFGKKEKKFKCIACDKSYLGENHLRTHVLNVHEGKKEHQCNFCEMEYHRSDGLRRHMVKTHGNQADNVKCDLCDKTFIFKSYLRSHLKNAHEETAVECNICHKKVKEKQIPTHMKSVHDKSKPYNCSTCFKSFTEQRLVKRHEQRFHRNVAEVNRH